MNDYRLAIARAAENLLGCPFQLHGRHVQRGVDCVGLVHCALKAVGRSLVVAEDYGLRNLTIDRYLDAATAAGLEEVDDQIKAGDILLFRLTAAQYHLGIISTQGRLVHAHAGLRRVVETPSPPPWPLERQWRLRRD